MLLSYSELLPSRSQDSVWRTERSGRCWRPVGEVHFRAGQPPARISLLCQAGSPTVRPEPGGRLPILKGRPLDGEVAADSSTPGDQSGAIPEARWSKPQRSFLETKGPRRRSTRPGAFQLVPHVHSRYPASACSLRENRSQFMRYSPRSVSIGSTEAARRAGMYVAAIAATSITVAVAP
jgi:hypothetical protein